MTRIPPPKPSAPARTPKTRAVLLEGSAAKGAAIARWQAAAATFAEAERAHDHARAQAVRDMRAAGMKWREMEAATGVTRAWLDRLSDRADTTDNHRQT